MRGLVLISPHFFIEDAGIAAVTAAGEAYATTDLRDVSPVIMPMSTMRSAAGAMRGSIPSSAIGTSRRNSPISACRSSSCKAKGSLWRGPPNRSGARGMLLSGQGRSLPGVKESPYREAPERTLAAVAGFVNRLLRDHHEGDLAAHAA